MVTHEILDSRFYANRTGLRSWRDLRFIGQPMWSKAEEDQLKRDCQIFLLDDPDSWTPPSASNVAIWAAAFDRYGVPLSDLFTYGLKLHPSSSRGPGEKYISPVCCQFLILIMVHPIFQGKINHVRYILQRVIGLRMGIHHPPVVPTAEINDDADPVMDVTAEILYNVDPWMDQNEAYHSALWLYIQEFGIETHPEIVSLVESITSAFKTSSNNNMNNTIPSDTTPHCRKLFLLQLWDLQFLVQVLNNIACPQGYLPAEEYHRQWLRVTRKVRPYIESKVDDLVEAWFLQDERNHRVRQKLIESRSGTPIWDVAEEDFRPLYAKSELITVGMRSVLCGDFLRPLCPANAAGRVDIVDAEVQGDIVVGAQGGPAGDWTGGMMELEMLDDVTGMEMEMQEDGKVNNMQDDGDDTVDEMQDNEEGATVNEIQEDAIAKEIRDDDTVSETEGDETEDEMQGTQMQHTTNNIDPQETESESEMQDTHHYNDTTQGTIPTNDDTESESPEDERPLPPIIPQDLDNSGEYEPSTNSGDDDDDYDNHDYEAVQARRSRRSPSSPSGSIASFHSISSSRADEWEAVEDEDRGPVSEHISRRGLPAGARNKPAFRRRMYD